MKKIILIGIVIITIFLLIIIYQSRFRATYELALPEIKNVVNISVEWNNTNVTITDMDELEIIMSTLYNITRTTKNESVQDSPINITDEVKLDFYDAKESILTLYVYNRKGKYYIEQPYNGIYPISREEYEILVRYLD